MKFVVVGQGGREHAIVRALRESTLVKDVQAVANAAGQTIEAADCVVIGPEVPLAEGLADDLRAKGIPTVGPSGGAARLESSKVFAKEFMTGAGVPTARYFVVKSVADCLKRASEFEPPYVLKADGLAAGKGVILCESLQTLERAAHSMFVDCVFGNAGKTAVLEEFQPGYELSYLVLTNGESFQALPVSQDHKRLKDGDRGPNTGGMGVVCPVPISNELRQRIETEIVAPTLKRLTSEGLIYRGVLYFGIMVTDSGPVVIEYNVRFGDPECQAILPLLDGDWGRVLLDLANGEMADLKWLRRCVAAVVLAAPGYPDAPQSVPIQGDPQWASENSYFLHAGIDLKGGKWFTKGGRVLNAMGLGQTMEEALERAYSQAEKVSWQGLQMRRDIGEKITKNTSD